jgi:colanic acid biosynthesis protein WcaH
MLSNNAFKEVIKNTNLFAFDLIIRNYNNEILVVKRNNSPAKGYFFVPGGRVFKNETLNNAFIRILREELSLEISSFTDISIKGLYNHKYDDNVFDSSGFNTHYIVYAIELNLKENIIIQLDKQHNSYQYFSIDVLLKEKLVHQYVKNYFLTNIDNIFNIPNKILELN